MPWRHTFPEYLASLLASPRRDTPDPVPCEMVQSDLDTLSDLVIKKDTVAMARVNKHLKRHYESVIVMEHKKRQRGLASKPRFDL